MHRANLSFHNLAAPPAWLTGTMRVSVTVLLGILAMSCSDDFIVAPDGSAIDVSATPTLLAVGGDSAVITAFITEQDGRWVEDGTKVTFVATGGGMCPSAPTSVTNGAGGGCGLSQALPAVLSASTQGGIATAVFRSGMTAGPAKVKARSGGASAEIAISLSALVAPSGATIALEAEPDTIAVGQAAAVLAFVAGPDGSPVQDGTRVLFTAPANTLSRVIALTHDGFARTTFVGRAAGTVTVGAASGPVRGEVTFVVQ